MQCETHAEKKMLLDERETALMIGLQVRTLQRWRVLGRGPIYRKIGGRAVRYHRDDIAHWLDAQPRIGGAHDAA